MENFDSLLPVVFGIIVGFSLGLTGGGGSIFAVPLLIYGLGIGVRESVGVSLAAVGATALFGALLRIRKREVEFTTGLVFAGAGMLGAPVGTWVGGKLPDVVTLSGFAILMLIVGFRMWKGSSETRLTDGPCDRDDRGVLRWNTPCAFALAGAGLFAGILSGIFGVGGGFIVVPALIMASGMPIHRAISTSLLVIALICVSGITSYAWTGPAIPLWLSVFFVAGGFAGMLAGGKLRSHLPANILNRVFATGMWLVALWILWRNWYDV